MRYYDLPLQMAPKDDRTISRQVSRKDRRPAERARLRVIFPPTAIAMAELGPVACEIGRAPDGGGILIDNPTISRRHVEVRWAPEAGAHTICDLVSRNGSWRNGERIGEQPVPLHDGDVVRIGDVFFVYEVGSALNAADSRLVSTDAIPGEAATVAQLRGQLAMAAIDAAPLLIVGETGTGKELMAREAHRLSRRTGELVVVNCAALSPQLIESQLFGHVRGAFTGATEAQAGLFRAAAGGTLFLDEIGELPLDLQPKLLRAIEMREVQPVGATKAVQVDVRVIAATHRRLDAAVEAGQFRRDLYARLSLWELRVPPLGRRRADTLEWLHRFWRRRYGEASTLTIEPDAVEKLLLAAWPTNLRGLDRLVHELDGLAKRNRPLHAADVPTWVTEAPPTAASELATASSPAPQKPPIPSRDEFIAAYEQCRGSVRALAKHFDRDRRQIYRWLEQHGLRGSSMG